MNRLNPLYLILLFVTIVFLSFYLIISEKKVFNYKVNESRDLQIKALEFKNLTTTWTNEKYINNILDEILKSQIFANQQITKTATKESIKIKIASSNQQVLDAFLNKILNKQLIIKKIVLDSNFIDLEVGIK